MIRSVVLAQARTVRDWARQYELENAPGASEVAFLCKRLAHAMEMMADGVAAEVPDRVVEQPVDEPKPD